MLASTSSADTIRIHTVWRNITGELAGVFDAHYVCSVATKELAKQAQTTSIVAISDPQHHHLSVWICDENGRSHQTRWDNKQMLHQDILNAKKSIRLEKLSRTATEIIQSELWLLVQNEIIAVPLPFPAGNNTVTPPGFICLADPIEGCYFDENNLELLASNITVFLDRANLRHLLERQNIEFTVVSDINHTLTSTLNLQTIYTQLSDTARRMLNVEALSVGLQDPITESIVFVDSLMDAKFKNLPSIRVEKGQGIAGWVAEHQEPAIVNDTYADKRFFSGADRDSGFRTKSMICIPLQVEERTIGVFQAINRHTGEFTRHDLHLMQAIGGPLAAAIENARLHTNMLAEKRRIETIFASMAEGIMTTSPEGVITETNEAFFALLGDNSHNLIGQNIKKILQLRNNSIDEFINTILSDDEDYPQLIADIRYRQSEYIPVLISGVPIKSDKDEVKEIIFAFSDLSQIRELERMREDFFQGIAHELRTPLATILMYARLLREGKAKDKQKTARFLGIIERESDRLQKMVRQMLQVSKQEARDFQRSPEPINLNQIFTEILPPFADQATEKGLTFRQRIYPKLPDIIGNVETLELILKNLIENAINFTPSGAILVDAHTDSGMVHITVEDEGIGMSPTAIPNLFKRFYRAQSAVERGIAGTGLGLYMVKSSVESMKGTIQVTSKINEGSKFVVQFPAIQD